MQQIHLKTIDPVSQRLLRIAAQRGLELNWERHERLQPQDGFLRLGLSCPYGCLRGPCRIDPFGRGPQWGLCGMGREQMVAAQLLRLCAQGAMEMLAAAKAGHAAVSWPQPLQPKVEAALQRLGGDSPDLQEVLAGSSPEHWWGLPPAGLLQRALRLGILALGLQVSQRMAAPRTAELQCRVGPGLAAGDRAVIAVCGRHSPAAVASLLEEGREVDVEIVSLGDWVLTQSGYLPFLCTSGEAELLLSAGLVHLVWAGTGVAPGIYAACEQGGVAVLGATEAGGHERVIEQALAAKRQAPPPAWRPEAEMSSQAPIVSRVEELAEHLEAQAAAEIALVGGSDVEQQTMGWIATEVAPALTGNGRLVAAWGDAALWLVKRGLADRRQYPGVVLLEPEHGPLLAVAALAEKADAIPGICFTALTRCRDLALALGLASLGTRVMVATPLPLWGSTVVMEELERLLRELGGRLDHLDHPADANEILTWLQR